MTAVLEIYQPSARGESAKSKDLTPISYDWLKHNKLHFCRQPFPHVVFKRKIIQLLVRQIVNVNWTIQWIGQMNFDIVDNIGEIETIAKGSGIREIDRLKKKVWTWKLGKNERNCLCQAIFWKDSIGQAPLV